MLIIIVLYATFLGDMQVNNIESEVCNGNPQACGKLPIDQLVISWTMAGLIIVNTVTVTLATLERMVVDHERELYKDFLAAPISRAYIILGYLLCTWFVGMIMSMISIFLIEIYIIMMGGQLLSFIEFWYIIIMPFGLCIEIPLSQCIVVLSISYFSK